MAPRSSFSSWRAYFDSVMDTPARLQARAFSVSSMADETNRRKTMSGSSMAKTLRWYDLVGLGIGGMVGAGIFITTGRAVRFFAGPSIILSYAIAGLCALFSAFCYTEFAVEMPVAGGAFSYLRVTFGDFPAFLTGANLVMEYVFSNAAVSRSFTAYLGTAIGVTATEKWRVTVSGLPKGFNELDFVAVAVIIVISVSICYSTKESSVLNIVLTTLHVAFIAFIICIGFWRGDWKNYTSPADPAKPAGFFPYGVAGVFNGAAMVYLSYIGYDAVSTMAEEVKNPRKDIPIGVSGSVVIVTVVYCLMADSMVKLAPYDSINVEAPFSSALEKWGWMSKVVGAGAAFGILTSVLVSMLGQARYLCVIGRSNIVPAWFAKVHPKTATPVNSTVFLGCLTAAIALVTDLQVLLNLVTIGTLFVFYMVANAVIYRRYVSVGTTNPRPALGFLFILSALSLGFTLLWQLAQPSLRKALLLGACAVIAFAGIQSFRMMVPQVRKPELWGVPLMPWVPCASVFLNVFLLGSLDGPSYIRFGFFSVIAVIFYVLYSVHASYDAEENDPAPQKSGNVEMQKQDWIHDGCQKV